MLRFIENYFLFKPGKFPKEWQEPPLGESIQDVYWETAFGRIHGWWVPPKNGNPSNAVLYCHGNGGNLSFRIESIRRWRDLLGQGVLIFDYPGYGKSQGKPSEDGCYASAEAAHNWLITQGYSSKDLILYGGSLGGAIATHLAAKFEPKALVLTASFTSFKDIAKVLFPWLPGKHFLKTKLDTLGKMPLVKSPVFVAHGTADKLVPLEHAQKLFDAAMGQKYFHKMDGHDHHHSPDKAFYDLLKSFLSHSFSETNKPDCFGLLKMT